MRTCLRVFSFLVLFSSLQLHAQQVPDFTMTDVNGNSHSLYADYLDQGIPVFISVAATWNPWDSVWVNSGVMDEFQATYGADAAVLFIEGDINTPESDLYGTGSSGNYDFVTGHDYAVIDDSAGVMQFQYGVSYFPYIIMICPDGTGYTQTATNVLMEDPDVFYGEFENADVIADKMYEHCGTNFDRSKLNGLVYTDLNTDCDEAGEIGVPMMIANITGPNGSFYKITDNNGAFRSLADEGTYTVDVTSPNSLWDVCDNPQSYTFVGTNDSTHMDFGLQANMQCTDPTVEISAPFLVRCFDTQIFVHYCNEGTIPMDNAEVTVTLDSFLIVNNISMTPSSQSGFDYTFDLGTLGIFECGDIVFDITVDCESELGTEQCYDAQISPDMGCNNNSNLLSSETEECQEIVGSYDPNDKRAYPFQEGDDYSIRPNEGIKYQIRFQNTGTFMAFKVEVLDQISSNLDLSTFRMGTASHDYEVFIEEDRTLRVLFDDIMLPDSNANEAASHGFFTYYIDQMTDLPDGSEIENQAGIYFDFNDPIITNTTIHTVDYNLVSVYDLEESLGFSVAPNPVRDFVQISLNDASITGGQYFLNNVNGQQMLSGTFNTNSFEVATTEMAKGIYFIQLVGDDGSVGVRKVLVQ